LLAALTPSFHDRIIDWGCGVLFDIARKLHTSEGAENIFVPGQNDGVIVDTMNGVMCSQ
jgi:hypothetical protein